MGVPVALAAIILVGVGTAGGVATLWPSGFWRDRCSLPAASLRFGSARLAPGTANASSRGGFEDWQCVNDYWRE